MATIENDILHHARKLGADLAGITTAATLKNSPSYTLLSAIGTKVDGVHAASRTIGPGPVDWPQNFKSILVIGLSHPQSSPQLDWFHAKGNTTGNSRLVKIIIELATWIETSFEIATQSSPYYVEKGGIYLKDAAVLAGLGCLGKNNLLLTPEFGPRVRLRAMVLEAELTPTGPVDFDPCRDCPGYCRAACPQNTFADSVRFPPEIKPAFPPARDGHFRRSRCMLQMDRDWEVLGAAAHSGTFDGVDEQRLSPSDNPVKHCRRCEFACPVGRQQRHTREH